MNTYDHNPYESSRMEADDAYTTSAHDRDVRTWGMLLHFSQLAGYAIPVAGLVAPILIWQIKKEELPELDEHGKIVANWIITSLIYWIICGLSVIILIGFPLLVIMGIICTVFPIVGGIKANNGEYWSYPGTFRFF